MTRSEGKSRQLWSTQVVHIEDPHLKSPAALALLAKQYFPLDKSIFTETRMARLRSKWMKQQMRTLDEKGGLTCAICGRKGLNPYTRQGHNNQATLDHIIELSRGGKWNDPANFQVACYKCNSNKNAVPKKTRLTSYMLCGKLQPETRKQTL